MKSYQKFAVFFLMAALAMAACTDGRDRKLAEEAVAGYHKNYNDRNFEEIFNAAHEEAKQQKSKEALWYGLAEMSNAYGRHLSSELVRIKIQPIAGTGEKQVDLAYQSKFEKGELNETFLVVVGSERARIYSIGKLTDEELEQLR